MFLEAWLGRVSKAWNAPGTTFSSGKKICRESPPPTLGRPNVNTIWAVSLRHAAIGLVRSALLMGGRRGSAVDIAAVAPRTIIALLEKNV